MGESASRRPDDQNGARESRLKAVTAAEIEPAGSIWHAL
jgi:hypothetical protein